MSCIRDIFMWDEIWRNCSNVCSEKWVSHYQPSMHTLWWQECPQNLWELAESEWEVSSLHENQSWHQNVHTKSILVEQMIAIWLKDRLKKMNRLSNNNLIFIFVKNTNCCWPINENPCWIPKNVTKGWEWALFICTHLKEGLFVWILEYYFYEFQI